MAHAYTSSRSKRLLSSLLDILCGKSYAGDDDQEKLIALVQTVVVMTPLILLLFYSKEFFHLIVSVFNFFL